MITPLAQIDSSAAALQALVGYGVLVVCVLIGGLWGLRARLFRAVLFFGSLVAASITAFAWCGAPSNAAGEVATAAEWSTFLTYVGVFITVFFTLNLVLYLTVRTDVVTYIGILDRLFGVAVGVAAGMLLASAVRVGFAMCPVSATAQISPQQMQFDVTPRVLRIAARILSSDPDVRRAWLVGGGVRLAGGQAGPGQITWSEPFVDFNGNRVREGDEPFLDKDGNGKFTVAYAAGDASSNDDSRVGVMDRYWLGSWPLVTVMDRKAAGKSAP